MRGRVMRLMRRLLIAGAGVAVLAVIAFLVLDAAFPPDMQRYEEHSTEILAADGTPLRIFPVEDGRIRRQVAYTEVDPRFIDMLVAYEDRRFFSHFGIDARALARAVFQAVWYREVVSGASTLTMQTARLLEPRPRTLAAKLTEMLRALQLERRYSKQEILEIYLTLAPYGGNLEGIKAATSAYFGHDTTHLTPDEAALLVALPQSPTRLRPDRAPTRARAARNKIIDRVAGHVGLAADLAVLAKTAPVPDRRRRQPVLAPHLADRLAAAVPRGERVQTSVDPLLQRALETLALDRAAQVHASASLAIIVVDNRSRSVIGYVGSPGQAQTARQGYVDMVSAVRSPGSTLKPFIYGLAFDRGLAHPATLIRDEPRRFGTYAPKNFREVHYGEITLSEALQRSLNIPAVAVLNRVGPVTFVETLRQAGVSVDLPSDEAPGLAVALGGMGMSLDGLATLYAALADDGIVRPLQFQRGELKQSTAPPGPLLRGDSRRALARILSDIRAPGDRLPRHLQANPRRIAFKTGTSYGFRDAWAIGFDARFTVGVWVGRPDGTPLPGRYGSVTAAPVLFDVFDRLPRAQRQEVVAVHTGTPLPPALRYFERPSRRLAATGTAATLDISFPEPETAFDYGGAPVPVSLKATGGTMPLQWFVNGEPLPQQRWSRSAFYRLGGPGFYHLSVVDALGQRRTSTVQVIESSGSR